ncbi:MAG: glycosyltransferase family 1 protein [Anaerolineales bacterium]|nr:MAG: glycosyltransferase family 1 protein [Anaerolineales bacterium]
MRIAMLSYHTCPLATLGGKDTGGMNVYVRDLTRELGRRGVGVDVFTRSQDEHVPHVLHDLGFGNRIVHIPAGPEHPLAKTELLEHIPNFVQGILDFVDAKDLHYDLLHSHYWLSGQAGLTLRHMWGIPLIQMFHTLALMKNRVARSEVERESNERIEIECRLLEEADRIVAATQAEVAQIQWLYQVSTEQVVVIPPGVDTGRFYPIDRDEAKEFIGLPLEKNLVLFVGRIESLKGIDTLLQAIAGLNDQGVFDRNGVCLAVIGGEADVSSDELSTEMMRLTLMSEELGLEEVVRFLGKRDQDTLPYYYSAARVVVVPSHYESFGLVALEAMACGSPVIASETGGLAFLIKDGETGFHVPAADIEALKSRLETLLTDDVLQARLGRQAAAYAQSYDWSHISDRILELYSSLLPRSA